MNIMNTLKYIVVILCFNTVFLLNNAIASHIPKTFPVSTTLDKNAFFSYKITHFSLVPNDINLRYLQNEHSFADIRLIGNVETEIPVSDISVSLTLRARELKEMCYDANSVLLVPGVDFVSLYLSDGFSPQEKMKIKQPIIIPDNVDINGFRASEFYVWMKFSTLPTEAVRCDGQITFSVEMSI